MIETMTIGASPAEEDCARLGRTPDFQRLNRLEVDCYQAALVARYGPPPAGAPCRRDTSDHDFGRYTELALRFESTDEAHASYAERVDEGLGRWFHAGFTAPVEYTDSTTPAIHHADLAGAIRSAISIMRPPFPTAKRRSPTSARITRNWSRPDGPRLHPATAHVIQPLVIGRQPDLFDGPTVMHERPPKPIPHTWSRDFLRYHRATSPNAD